MAGFEVKRSSDRTGLVARLPAFAVGFARAAVAVPGILARQASPERSSRGTQIPDSNYLI
jgi:hypothetical protein